MSSPIDSPPLKVPKKEPILSLDADEVPDSPLEVASSETTQIPAYKRVIPLLTCPSSPHFSMLFSKKQIPRDAFTQLCETHQINESEAISQLEQLGFIESEQGKDFMTWNRNLRVLILGGGYAGRRIAKHLEKLNKQVDVTIVNDTADFISKPATPYVMVNTKTVSSWRLPLASQLTKTRIKVAQVKEVDADGNVQLAQSVGAGVQYGEVSETIDEAIERWQYDLLVICTGPTYNLNLLNVDTANPNTVPVKKGTDMNSFLGEDNEMALLDAKRICVIGGGATGCEVTFELAARFPDKQIIVIKTREWLERQKGADQAVNRVARRHKNIEIHTGYRVDRISGNELFASKIGGGDPLKMETDYVVAGIGFVPLTPFLPKTLLDGKGAVHVTQSLQSEQTPYIFAAGDVTSIQEEKCSATAYSHADLLIQNIKLLAKGTTTLKTYKPRTLMMLVSVGPSCAVLSVNGKVYMSNGLMLKAKFFVEKKLMKAP